MPVGWTRGNAGQNKKKKVNTNMKTMQEKADAIEKPTEEI
jgi:hypothetical protein